MSIATSRWATSYVWMLVSGCYTTATGAEVESTADPIDVTVESTSETYALPQATANDGELRLDVGIAADLSTASGCQNVDFLFVVDNSRSMYDNQAHLIASFPDFIAGIQATLSDVEGYHVGIVPTEPYPANIPGCQDLGGLIVKTGGERSSNRQCGPYAGGANYLTELDDLAAGFACAAQVGTEGPGIEKPMHALETVVRGDLGGVGQCNEGFMRDDALLVAVIITDEGDGPRASDIVTHSSDGTADDWFKTVVDAKGGDPSRVVVLTLSYINGGDCPPPNASGDPRSLQIFAEMFGENGFLGCINGDYGEIFSEATSVIETACNNFIPPG